jgi:RIO-like serine/threonine protein kinase
MRLHGRIGRCVGIGVVIAVFTAAVAQPAWAAASKSRDLVVLDHERWLDTLKGTVKNYSKLSARDVTVIVKFFDKKKALGTQRVNVGDLRSGDQSSWSLPISEKHRAATHYEFETHALWK